MGFIGWLIFGCLLGGLYRVVDIRVCVCVCAAWFHRLVDILWCVAWGVIDLLIFRVVLRCFIVGLVFGCVLHGFIVLLILNCLLHGFVVSLIFDCVLHVWFHRVVDI